jgi:purine-binding chemotaxis protein CheW
METPHRFCTFSLGGYLFGVTLIQVQEVLRPQPMTKVPLASETIAGLINLRGQIVTAIDLRKLLLLGERPEGKPAMNVILRNEDGLVSLLVDEIGDVLEMPQGEYERPPETLQGRVRECIDGVYKLPNRLLLVLNSAQVTGSYAAAA